MAKFTTPSITVDDPNDGTEYIVTCPSIDVSQWVIDWDRVQTLDDMKMIMQTFTFNFAGYMVNEEMRKSGLFKRLEK